MSHLGRPDEIAVCNLASIALNMYVDQKTKTFNFEKLHDVVKVPTCRHSYDDLTRVQVATRNLNRIIDINFYPVKEARHSNMRYEPSYHFM